MESKYYRSWHLAKTPTEYKVTEFEYVLARVFEAFARWVTAAGDMLVNSDIKFSEHLILHVIRMQNRPKSGTTIARMINRDDLPNIQYSLRKLEAAKLIKKTRDRGAKTFSYSVTKLGEQVTTEYANIRAELLMNNLSAIADIENRLVDATQVLSVLTGIYEEAARNSATYNAQPALTEEAQDTLPTPKSKRRKSGTVREQQL
jgi:predicted MarR family transcription regulator